MSAPRLILRLGGLGNQYFGKDNGIAEEADGIREAAKTACRDVLAEVDAALLHIQEDEKENQLHHWPDPPALWKTHLLALLFGKMDRWSRERLCGLPAGVFSPEKPKVTLLTGGADGGDAMIRDIGLARGKADGAEVSYEHFRIVPLPPGEVADGLGIGSNPDPRKDLKGRTDSLTRQEAAELAENVRSRAYGFRAQSEALRHHSDILMAIWDPDAEGKAGGTSESVAAALQQQIPVIAIRIRGAKSVEIHVLRSLGNLRALQGLTSAWPSSDWKKELKEVLIEILGFPDPPIGAEHEASSYHPRAALAAFLDNRPPKPIWPARFWHAFEAQSSYRGAKHGAKKAKKEAKLARTHASNSKAKAASSNTKEDLENSRIDEEKAGKAEACSKALWAKLPELRGKSRKELRKSISRAPGTLMPEPTGDEGSFEFHYGWAKKRADTNGLGGIYSHAHRGGIITSYLLASFAVVLALAGAVLFFLMELNHVPIPHWTLFAVAALELGVIGFMFALSVCANNEDWNEAYTDFRILTEALRMMAVLGPMGVHTPLPRQPHYLRDDGSTGGRWGNWAVWYFRALVRMAPLRLKGPDPDDLAEFRRTVNEDWIDKQIIYHLENAAKQEKLEHDIESLSKWLFGVVGIAALVHVLEAACGGHFLFLPCLVICVAGPALIAALHGFSSQIEIARLLRRSSGMVKLLESEKAKISASHVATRTENALGAEAVWFLTSEALSTAGIMMDEATDWSTLYRNNDIHAG